MKPYPRARSLGWFFFLVLQCLVTKAFQGGKNSNRLSLISFFFFSISHSWRVSHVIYLLLIDLGPPFVDHAGCYFSACPICRLLQLSVSCSNQGDTVQGSFRFNAASSLAVGI